MGDRSNIFIQHHKYTENDWTGIGLYSHWGGLGMHDVAIKAAQESTARLGDPSYFTRRVLHKILNAMDPECSETSWGIWTDQMDDNEYPILVINADSGQAWYADDESYALDVSETSNEVVDVRDGKLPTKPEGWDD